MLPLSFFGKRDLADLTTVIMKDAADQERLFSHTMPQAFGTGISTVIVAVMLLVFDWRLACASLWPVPVALLILLATSRAQTAKTRGKNAAALALADDIQEYLESNREVRALNRADDFLGRLNDDVDAFERAKLASELVTGTAVVCTQTLLRLGIVTTILVGTALVAAGQCSLLVFFCFMLVVTRLYDPIGLILQSVAELIDMTQSLARMKAIEGEPAQTGELTFNPQGHDIVFDDVTFAYDDGEHRAELRELHGPGRARSRPWWGRPVPASPRRPSWRRASGMWARARCTVGGVDVSGIDPETLLTDYTEVFQDVVLFDGTVMENIRLGRRDATDEEVLAAARAANCDEFVQKHAPGLRHAHRRERRAALRRRAPTHLHRPGHSERRPHRASGRGHGLAGRGERDRRCSRRSPGCSWARRCSSSPTACARSWAPTTWWSSPRAASPKTALPPNCSRPAACSPAWPPSKAKPPIGSCKTGRICLFRSPSAAYLPLTARARGGSCGPLGVKAPGDKWEGGYRRAGVSGMARRGRPRTRR